MSHARLAPLILLLGCRSQVDLTELERFGRVSSALWVHWRYDDTEHDTVELTTVNHACSRLQDWGEINAVVRKKLEKLPYNQYCSEGKDAMSALAAAGQPLYGEGASWLHLSVASGAQTKPGERTYGVGDDRNTLSGSLDYYLDDPGAAYDDWDEHGDPADNCGVNLDRVEEAVDSYTIGGGQLTFTEVQDEDQLRGELDAHVQRRAGVQAGDITAEFRAEWCEVVY